MASVLGDFLHPDLLLISPSNLRAVHAHYSRLCTVTGYALVVAPVHYCAAPSTLIIPKPYETHPPKPQPLPLHPVPIGGRVSGTSGWVK